MPSRFQPTRWSLIHEAAATDASQRNRAWEEFDHLYREPLYRFIRRSGWPEDRAEDLLQSFLAKLADRDWLSQADAERGKMRTFLLQRLKRHLNDVRKHDHAQKRGSGSAPLSLDEFEPSPIDAGESNDRQFDREWAEAILDRAFQALRTEAEQKNRSEIFDLLKNQITGDSPERLSEAATKLSQSEGAVRMQLQRLREKFRQRLRAEVAETLLPDEDLSTEMRYLAQVLS